MGGRGLDPWVSNEPAVSLATGREASSRVDGAQRVDFPTSGGMLSGGGNEGVNILDVGEGRGSKGGGDGRGSHCAGEECRIGAALKSLRFSAVPLERYDKDVAVSGPNLTKHPDTNVIALTRMS